MLTQGRAGPQLRVYGARSADSKPDAARRPSPGSEYRQRSQFASPRLGRWAHGSPDIRPHRRHRRIGHPGRRRQGQGPQGGRPAGHRFRRRRAGLPDAGLHRRGGDRGGPQPEVPPLHAGRPGCPNCAPRSPPRRCATPAMRSTPAQVLITNGGKQAVYNAFATLLDPGDEVLLIAPYWTTYPEAIKLAGGVPVEVFTDETSGYLATVEQLEAARTPRTKVLLFVSPSNPTGAVYPPDAGRGDRPVGGRARAVGRHRRDLRAPRVRRRREHLDRHRAPRGDRSSSSTVSRRPTP